ncbi:MAG: phosphoribosylformylglycinamidine cyclo-ligase [Zetaproteobacteria bacterium]|nr:MAG: phosphoribosylformylglycinamidine cyclo-ligase [Zetaproteobacteria bacterium]
MKEQIQISAYKKAGVDIDAAADLVEQIKPAIKKTARKGVMSGIGGFGAMFDLKEAGYDDPILVSSTDGVGTKIKISIDSNTHNTIGIDAVAMCVNDLIVQGAEPLFFLDYFATGKLENTVAKAVIESVAKGCEIAGCALIGGETAEMPGLYADGDYDLAGFTVGAVNRDALITGETITEGHIILGLASNGIHSNGYSLVRKIIQDSDEFNYDSPVPFDMIITAQEKDITKQTTYRAQTLNDALLAPTRIYVKSLLQALKIKSDDKTPAIKGMAHITGGGLTENIPRVLPDGFAAHIDTASWKLPAIFTWLKELGNLENYDLARTLNCGIGMIVICDPKHVKAIEKSLISTGETVYKIGEIKKQKQSDISIILQNLAASWG